MHKDESTDERTVVYVYSERRRRFVPSAAGQVVCECGAGYDAMYWDTGSDGRASRMLVCESCGEQYSTLDPE